MAEGNVEANVAVMRRWYAEVWNQWKTDLVHEVVAPDAVIRGVSETGEVLRGPGGFLAVHQRLKSAFPDMRVELEDCFGVGDKVMVRWSAEMHHTGEGMGMPATGAAIRVTGMSLVRFADGKAVESWDEWDKAAMFRQLEGGRAKAAAE